MANLDFTELDKWMTDLNNLQLVDKFNVCEHDGEKTGVHIKPTMLEAWAFSHVTSDFVALKTIFRKLGKGLY
ncbi:hypothetical protein Smp_156380 [Schistosoma mansoni]|uniref:hypothetical protein n=1 Tax=Schistosoma mansoni TaxID=6183 RepID=UPI0001A640F9|nr:hypothetical protein Smp_156380 [Schistosoma mansoni]|eukprot:XP_018651190.1 hypothetical protein Smp_156380 [Schistosoma mansoni]